jgi:hypothetical protein
MILITSTVQNVQVKIVTPIQHEWAINVFHVTVKIVSIQQHRVLLQWIATLSVSLESIVKFNKKIFFNKVH